MRDRVVVRDRLQRLSMLQENKNVCPICNEGKEDRRHLFVYCARVYRVWMWCYLGGLVLFPPSSQKMLIWQMTSSILLWSICRLRNHVVFQRDNFDQDRCYEMCRYELAWWIKAKWGELVPSVLNIMQCPSCIDVPRKPRKNRDAWVWRPLGSGILKINVDESFLGNSDRGSIGGLTRGLEGNILLQFCKVMWVDLAVHTEIFALREGRGAILLLPVGIKLDICSFVGRGSNVCFMVVPQSAMRVFSCLRGQALVSLLITLAGHVMTQ